ncbi:MAG: inositol monophosphatase family protein [bacterium]|nr:inositol monophosphatase family protein [bacterium]
MPVPKDFLEVAIEAAKAAGRIQIRNLSRRFHTRTKGAYTNLVTDVDLRCEKRIVATIDSHFPGHGIHAEEGARRETPSPYRWIIDPLDGTTNYAHGYPVFCTAIALEHEGEIIVGVVYDATRRELFTSEKGKGARLNGTLIAPSQTSELSAALLVTGFPYDFPKTRKNLDHFTRFSLSAQAVRRDGSAALNLCYTAMGRFDGFWEYGLAPWDLAAGSLMVKESGGRITRTSGRPFSIDGGNVLATNGSIHGAMRRVFQDGGR